MSIPVWFTQVLAWIGIALCVSCRYGLGIIRSLCASPYLKN
jgi:hypothetical protein